MEWIVEYYKDVEGNEPAAGFIDTLQEKTKAKVFRTIKMLKEYGVLLKEPYTRQIRENERFYNQRRGEIMKKAATKGYIRGTTLDEYKAEQMKDPEFKKAWDDLEPEFELLGSMIKARERKKISQAELAERLGTKQSAISRLERGAFSKATVETLRKIADALDSRLIIKLQAKKAG